MSEMKEILDMAVRMKLEGEELKSFLKEQQDIQREHRELRRDEIRIFEEQKNIEEEKLSVEKMKIAHDQEVNKMSVKLEEMKIEHERIVAKQKNEIERERLEIDRVKEDDRRAGNFGKSKLPVFNEDKDTVDAFIARFENFAKLRKWDKSIWAIQLSLLLTGKALETYDSLTVEQQASYDDLKAALLRRFNLTEESFRRKFFTVRPEKSETPSQFTVQLSRTLDRWIDSTGIEKNYESVKDLLICEQFLKQCHSDLEAYLREGKNKKFEDLAKVAERYIDAHGGSIGEPRQFNKKKYANVPDVKQSKDNVKSTDNEKWCKYCKKSGHDVSECWKLARKNESEQSDVKGVKKCYVCGSRDHIASKCPVRKDGSATASVGGENEFVDLDGEGNISTGSVNGEPLIVLRDTGSDVMIVCEKLVKPDQYTKSNYNLELVDGTKRSYPVARIPVNTKYVSGEIEAAVMPTPIYDLIIGNSLFGILQNPARKSQVKQFSDVLSEISVDPKGVVSPKFDGVVNTISTGELVSPSRRKSLLKKARTLVKQKLLLGDVVPFVPSHQIPSEVCDSLSVNKSESLDISSSSFCEDGDRETAHLKSNNGDHEMAHSHSKGVTNNGDHVMTHSNTMVDSDEPSPRSESQNFVSNSNVDISTSQNVLIDCVNDVSCSDLIAGVTTRAMSKKKMQSPLLVPEPELVSGEMLKAEQRSDETLSPFWKLAENSGEAKRKNSVISYEIRNGVLYRIFQKTDCSMKLKQVLVPLKLRNQVLKLAHDTLMSGHCGVRRTLERVTSNFYWPGVGKEVARYCRSCDICQKTTDKGRVGKVPLIPLPQIRIPFTRVAVDLVGPLVPSSERGYRWILTLVDYTTRYPEAVPLKSIDTVSVAEALLGIFTRVGFPSEVLSDRGSQFVSDIMKEVDRLLSITPLYSSPYHPCCNGLVERFNSSLKKILKRLCAECPKQWDRYLPAVLYAYRSVRQESTGYTPFEILYGRKIKGPMELLRAYWDQEEADSEVKTMYKYVLDLKNRLQETCQLAQEELSKSAQKHKLYYDKRAKPRSVAVGEEVLLLLPTKSNKLLLQWRGPYVVTKKVNQVDYMIRIRGKEKLFHINMLKHYVRRVPDKKVASIVCLNDGGDEVDSQEIIDVCPLVKSEDFSQVVISQSLASSQREELYKLLQSHEKVLTNLPGHTDVVKHKIELTSTQPVRGKSYPLPYSVRDTIRKEVKDMLSLGVIQESSSPYSAPPVIVKKPDGSNRFCINYKALNAVTVFDSEPMPDPEEIFIKLNSMKYKSKFDLSKGYWQISMDSESVSKSAFSTPDGHYEFTRMPFGMKNSAATFNRLMRKVLGSTNNVGCFIDDVIVYNHTWSHHLDSLNEVLTKLDDAGLTVKPSKCMLGFENIEFLGHEIRQDVIAPRRQKVSEILAVERPTTKRQVRAYIAMAGYYSKFIPNYSTLTAPLSDLTKKSLPNKVKWEDKHEQSFQTVRQCLSNEPVLRIFNPEQMLFVQTDASETGIGGCLLQKFQDKLHPVRYLSRKLNSAERRYSTIEKECLAIVWAIQKLKAYLYGNQFVMLIDHAPLQFMKESNIRNSRIMRWSLFLQDWNFSLEHIKGVQNHVADFLSRA